LVDIPIAQNYSWNRKRTPDANRQEHETRLLSIEAIQALKHIRERREEREQHRKIECHVKGQESDDRFRDEHVKRTEQSDGEHELYFRSGGGEGRGWKDVAAFLGTALEEGFLVGFLGDDSEEEGENGEEDEGPLSPAPRFADGYEGADDRP